jgi:hypothetical protein
LASAASCCSFCPLAKYFLVYGGYEYTQEMLFQNCFAFGTNLVHGSRGEGFGFLLPQLGLELQTIS